MTMFKETGIRQQVIEEIIQIAKLNHVEKVNMNLLSITIMNFNPGRGKLPGLLH